MKYLLLIFALLFSACSVTNYEHTQTKIIIIKSPLIKFADVGYIRNSDDEVSLELFSAGVRVEEITINHLICVSDGCMSKGGFNKEYLHNEYPDDTLQDILLARPIFDGKALIKTEDGFEQKIKTKHIDITYRVNKRRTFFKDKRNRIILNIKELL